MKRNMLFCLLMASTLAVKAQTKPSLGTFIIPTDKNIQYIGRIEDSHPERPTFTYPGVQIRCGFTGTSLSMVAKPQSGYFMVEIDGGTAQKVAFLNNNTVPLASGLNKGQHQVVVTYITEGYERLPEFQGFIVDEGESSVPATNIPTRKIEFIGNSITCGYGIEAQSANEPYRESTANYYFTYTARTARNLNAQAVVVARSGIGVYRNYNGPQTGDAVNMNTEYPYTLLYNNKYVWDFSRYMPDVVCINLGTNDTSTQGADSLLFVQAFKRLYHQVRSHYPQARIVLLSGSMMTGKALLSAQQAMDATRTYAHQQGDREVYRFDLTPQDGSLGIGLHGHPTMRQHEKMAEELTAYLRQLMKW